MLQNREKMNPAGNPGAGKRSGRKNRSKNSIKKRNRWTRGEIFTERFSTDKQRTYFFNVKENRLGDLFLNIVESKESESSLGFERHQIVIFKEDLKEFLQVLNRSIDAMNNPSKKRVKIIKKK